MHILEYVFFAVYTCTTPVLFAGELWSLLAAVGTLSVDHVRFILGSLTLATQHMHARHYVYRDFKPENVMLASDGYVKLIDFGFCKKLVRCLF